MKKKQTRTKAVHRFPRILLRLLLLLAVLLMVGSLLFSAWQSKIEKVLYPRKYEEYVEYYADKYDLDPLALYSFIRTESNFNPQAESDVGARGLMQITEVTFDWIKSKIAPTEQLTFDDLYDPETNIRFGSYFVAYCLLKFGDLATAAAAYHNGVTAVSDLLKNPEYSSDGTTLDEFPYPQMWQYVHKITTSYARYQEIYADQ